MIQKSLFRNKFSYYNLLVGNSLLCIHVGPQLVAVIVNMRKFVREFHRTNASDLQDTSSKESLLKTKLEREKITTNSQVTTQGYAPTVLS